MSICAVFFISLRGPETISEPLSEVELLMATNMLKDFLKHWLKVLEACFKPSEACVSRGCAVGAHRYYIVDCTFRCRRILVLRVGWRGTVSGDNTKMTFVHLNGKLFLQVVRPTVRKPRNHDFFFVRS